MYAVIFRAKVKHLDALYSQTAAQMRELAMTEYGCKEFTAVTEGEDEIAISYWESQEDILKWKKDSEHLAAQQLGKKDWYSWYQVQVVEILREYQSV